MKRIFYDRLDKTSIVQQMNYSTTKDVVNDFFTGKNPDINPGNTTRSFDFPDGNVDFDSPRFAGFENLIDQYVNKCKIIEHFKPKSDDPAPPVDPPPPPVEVE